MPRVVATAVWAVTVYSMFFQKPRRFGICDAAFPINTRLQSGVCSGEDDKLFQQFFRSRESR
jgi:hypothetical protein